MTTDNTNDIIIYQSPDGTTSLDVRLDHETVWLTQKQMAELFDKDSDTIGLHIRNAYKEGELQPDGTTEDSSVVQDEGNRKVRRKIRFGDEWYPLSLRRQQTFGRQRSGSIDSPDCGE